MQLSIKLLIINSMILITSCTGIGGGNDTSSQSNGFGVTSILPAENSQIKPDDTFLINFNNNVDSGSIHGINLLNITKKSAEPLSCKLLDNTTINCIPVNKLSLSSKYNLVLSGIRNKAQNQMNDKTISYNTITQPYIVNATPESGTISVNATSFNILFNESMNINTLNSSTTTGNVKFVNINGQQININCNSLSNIEMQCIIPNSSLVNGQKYNLVLTNNIVSSNNVPILPLNITYNASVASYSWNVLGNNFSSKILRLDTTSTNDLYVTLQGNTSIYRYNNTNSNWDLFTSTSPTNDFAYVDPNGDIYRFYNNDLSYAKLVNQTWQVIGKANIINKFDGFPYTVDCLSNICNSYPTSYNNNIILSSGVSNVYELINGDTINIKPNNLNPLYPITPVLSKRNYYSGDYDLNGLLFGMYFSHDYTQADGTNVFYYDKLSNMYLYSNNTWKNITYDFPIDGHTQYLQVSKSFLENNNNIFVVADIHASGQYHNAVKGIFRLDNNHWNPILTGDNVDFRAVTIDNNNLYFANNNKVYKLDLTMLTVADISPTGYIDATDKIKSLIIKNNNLYIATEKKVLEGMAN